MPVFPLRLFLKDPFVVFGVAVSFLENLFLWIYVPIMARKLGELAFLHYTIHFGVDFIGNWTRLLLIPVLSLIIFFVHTALGYWLYSQAKNLARFLLISQVVFSSFLIISSIALFIIN